MIQKEHCLNYLNQAKKECPDRTLMVLGERKVLYSELFDLVEVSRKKFLSIGIHNGSKVALYSDDYLSICVSIFALWNIGAVVIPMNPAQKDDKHRVIESQVKPDLGIYTPDFEVTYKRDYELFNINEIADPDQDTVEAEEVNLSELALVLFTSGSSGAPKGVPITHEALYHNTWSTANALSITEVDRIFVNTPPYTTSSLIHVLTMMAKCASVVIERGLLFGDNLMQRIIDNDCTGFGGVPVHFTRIASSVEAGAALGSLRFLMNSGDHLPVPVIQRMRKTMPSVQIYCVYGLTEVAGRFCILDYKDIDVKLGSVGKPIPEMKLVIKDEQGNLVKPNESGEVYVTGKALTAGYLDNPEVNKREFIDG